MKIFFNLIIIFSLVISFISGYAISKYISNKRIKQITEENQMFIAHSIQLQKRIDNERKFYIEETYKNPIDKKEAYCINKTNNSSDLRTCIYDASEDWEKEINKYLLLLKKSTTKEQYKIIKDSQNLWIKEKEKDYQVVDKFIYNHGGTMYFDIAAGEYKDIIKNRALFLKNLYLVHTDKY